MARGNFTGTRSTSVGGDAAKLMKLEIIKGGKIPIPKQERYKRILKKKLAEQREKAREKGSINFALPGARPSVEKMSRTTKRAMEVLARKEAIKEEKALRQMVGIVPRRYGEVGRMDQKGNVYDEASNLVLKVDYKTGKIKTLNGWCVGKYKPKSSLHEGLMVKAILKNSPYHAKLRLQKWKDDVAKMYTQMGMGQGAMGAAGSMSRGGPGSANLHGMVSDPLTGQLMIRNNISVTAWGVTSNNVHGTTADNVWGGMSDNVWGSMNSDVWGNMSPYTRGEGANGGGHNVFGDTGGFWGNSGIWSRPGKGIWRSADNRNYIKRWFKMLIAPLFAGSRNRIVVRRK